jgi:hypothetical protein
VVRTLAPRLKARVPPPQTGWHAFAHAVLTDGTLARLETSYDVAGALREHHRKLMEKQQAQPWPPYGPGVRERIAVFDGTAFKPTPDFALAETAPAFDRLSNGDWIVANMRCARDEANARFIAADGTVRHTMHLGDGIEHLQSDGAGGFWVGYFDEGVFGDTIGGRGLNRFDGAGRLTWSYKSDTENLYDCYALNAVKDAVWICPYDGFPLQRVGFDGTVRTWSNAVKHGAGLLAVDGKFAVLLGGYADERRHGVLLRLGAGQVDRIADFELDLDVDDLRRLPLATGRGDALHVLQGDAWSELRVSDIAKDLT